MSVYAIRGGSVESDVKKRADDPDNWGMIYNTSKNLGNVVYNTELYLRKILVAYLGHMANNVINNLANTYIIQATTLEMLC